MASSYNRYAGPSATGLKKDIVDKLHYVQTVDCVIFDTANNTVAKDGVYHYWTSTVYAKPTQNAYKRACGASLSTTFTAPTKTEHVNYIEESAVPFDVTKRAAAAAKRGGVAGVKDQWKAAKMEAAEELKYGVEYALLLGVKATGDGSTASQMDGLFTMAAAAASTGTVTSATFQASGEAQFKALLSKIRGAGGLRGKKKVALMSYDNVQRVIDGWTGRATATNDVSNGNKKIFNDVDVYVSQFGPIAVMGHDILSATDGVGIYDAEMLNLAWLYKTETIELGTTNLVEGMAALANALTLEYDKPSTLGLMKVTAS